MRTKGPTIILTLVLAAAMGSRPLVWADTPPLSPAQQDSLVASMKERIAALLNELALQVVDTQGTEDEISAFTKQYENKKRAQLSPEKQATMDIQVKRLKDILEGLDIIKKRASNATNRSNLTMKLVANAKDPDPEKLKNYLSDLNHLFDNKNKGSNAAAANSSARKNQNSKGEFPLNPKYSEDCNYVIFNWNSSKLKGYALFRERQKAPLVDLGTYSQYRASLKGSTISHPYVYFIVPTDPKNIDAYPKDLPANAESCKKDAERNEGG